ncbi:helix-turn-helix domain-containing protein [Candidatus Woesearchaeota archaeon]|nr:helix-turn-helix domain-containing protein [Candidatus Woesearchaeota archaeon]
MYKFSFKVRHKGCHETRFSLDFPKHHITVIDIQSTDPEEKQYFYYITGSANKFDEIITYLKKSKGYKLVKEIERSRDTLLLLVVLHQTGYIQNIIQKHHGFFIELHTVSEGYEYWHVGVIKRESIDDMLSEFKKMGELKVLHIGEVEFENTILSKQQKKVFTYAHEQGYYGTPRKTTIAKIAKALNLNSSTVGEHLLKAENKIINLSAKRI